MTNEQSKSSATEQAAANTTPYTAEVSLNRDLGLTVISLGYKDKENPVRNISVLYRTPDLFYRCGQLA
jgi:hypothetical protein